MAVFSVPKSPARQVINIDTFEGVDFTNSPANIADNKSPYAVNMVRDVPGKVRKRMGYELAKAFLLDEITPPIDGREGSISSHQIIERGATTRIVGMVSYQKMFGSEKVTVQLYEALRQEHLETYTSLSNNFTLAPGSYGIEADIPCEFVFKDENGNEVDISNVEESTHVAIYMKLKVGDMYTGAVNLKILKNLSGAINGYHFRNKDDIPLYHVGTDLIKNDVVIYSGMADAISHSWAFNDNLYIIDGLKMLKYDGDTVEKIEDVGYVPTLTIAKSPHGGGTQYEAFNLLSDGFTETFLGEAGVTAYQMTFGELNEKEVLVEILNSNAEWVTKTEDTDFTVDRTNGIINFTTAPGESPLTGEDNVKITAFKNIDDYADRINKCTFGTRFGVNGAFDRLFLSGNPDYPNADWYSQQWDATYFPDTGYSLLGSSQSAIVGYSIISNYLAAHKDEMERDLSIIIREGDLVDNEPSFKIINTLQGAGAIAPNSFAYLRTEPLFLTRNGLFAVTAQDITGEKYAQSRSFFLNGKMMSEDYEKLTKAFAIIHNDMYLLAVNNNLYILDGLQPIRTDKSEPYATRQYAAFYCDNLPIHYMYVDNNRLYFGTKDGMIFRFYEDKNNIYSYNDNGKPISAYWETADLEGNYFYKNKSFRYLAVKLGAALATSIKVFGMRKGVWSQLKEDNTKGRFFSYSRLIYSKLSYSTDKTERIVASKISIKKVDKARFRFENSVLNEPFSLFAFAVEYNQNNNVKG